MATINYDYSDLYLLLINVIEFPGPENVSLASRIA